MIGRVMRERQSRTRVSTEERTEKESGGAEQKKTARRFAGGGDDETHSQLTDPSGLSTHINISLAPSPSVKKRKVSLLFDHMEPDEMAKHLSHLESLKERRLLSVCVVMFR
ncbi:unnamed protein product [Arctogadus glacialis]